MNGSGDVFGTEKPRRWRRWLKRVGKWLLTLAIFAAGAWFWMHYRATKALQEKLAAMDAAEPGWRIADIEAAREQIPEEENSARVIVAAAKHLPPQWPAQEFDELFAHLAPQEQLDPEDFARLKKELEELRPALEQARKLAGMPRGRHRLFYQRWILDTRLADQQDARRVVTLLRYDALRSDQVRDMKAALVSCRSMLNAARSLGDEPLAISQLVRMAGVMVACQAAERALAQGEPPAEELEAMRHALDEEDAFPDLPIIARGERAFAHETFDVIESGDVPPSKLEGTPPNWKDYAFGWFMREKFREDHPVMLTLMNRWLAIAELPMHEQAEAGRQFEAELLGLRDSNPRAGLLIPSLQKVGEASRRKHASMRCMIVALAAERYRQKNKKWPDSLDKLCPKYLTAVPLDPFDGQPLRYRRLEDGVVIYSVGEDAVDNSGNLNPERVNRRGVDMGYRLWDISKRRQPPRPKPKLPWMQ